MLKELSREGESIESHEDNVKDMVHSKKINENQLSGINKLRAGKELALTLVLMDKFDEELAGSRDRARLSRGFLT